MKTSTIKSKELIYLQESFEQWYKLLGYTDKNIIRYLKEFLIWLEQNKVNRLKELNQQHITAYREYLQYRPKKTNKPGALSLVTVNKHIGAVRMFSRFLQESGRGSIILKPERFPAKSKERKVLSRKEIKALYKAALQSPLAERDLVMLDIYYGCGLRASEGINLNVNDVIMEKALIHVRHGKGHTRRYVPINKSIQNHIRAYLKGQREDLLRGKKQEALLISAKGNRIAKPTLFWRIDYLRKTSGIKSLEENVIGLHILRHSIATHLLQGGMKLEMIKEFLGHKTLDTTQIYTHLANETGE